MNDAGLAVLDIEWWDWAAVAQELGIPVSKVRQLVKEHQLAQAVPIAGAGPRVPADFLAEGEIVKESPAS